MHGDLDLSHIYTDGEKYTGIIDFGDIVGSNIYTDLAHYVIYSAKCVNSLVGGYFQVTKLDKDWRKRVYFSGIPIALYKLYWIIENVPENNEGVEVKFLERAVSELLNCR